MLKIAAIISCLFAVLSCYNNSVEFYKWSEHCQFQLLFWSVVVSSIVPAKFLPKG